MVSFNLESTIKLRDGHEMPVFGFGTYELDGRDAYNTVTWALEAGYRHVDSAEWYENERECGQAILDFCANHSIPRTSIFYTSKLKNNNGYGRVRRAIDKSVKDCGLGYIDLYLVHGPIGGPRARMDSWKAICEAQKEGKIKSIGVSNFGVRHMKELVESDSVDLPIPAVNQVDLHPFQTRTDIVSYCREHEIVLEAWAPLVRGLRFRHPSIVALAQKYGKEPAQILLRYSLQKGYVTIPKASSKERIISNTKIFDFELEQADVDALDALDEGLITDWDPTDCP